MSDVERLRDLVENKRYLIKQITDNLRGMTILFLHRGGGPPPESTHVTLQTNEPKCKLLAYGFFNRR